MPVLTSDVVAGARSQMLALQLGDDARPMMPGPIS
jgi:hypothetical protein